MILPGKLDWYIIRRFFGTFALTLGLFIVIIIVFDISEKLDDFLEKDAPLKEIVFSYYMNYIPFFLNMFSPIFIFISVLFFTSQLAMRSEFISMLAAGISFNRILRPYMIAAAFLAYFSYLLNAWIIPRADKVRMEFENKYLRGYWSKFGNNFHRKLAPDVFMYIEYFNQNDSTGGNMQLEKYKGGKIESKLFAERIVFNKKTNKWKLSGVFIREYLATGSEKLTRTNSLDTALDFNPRDFFFKAEDNQSLNMTELRNFIKNEKKHGVGNLEAFETELYRRYSTPFSTFILTMIGVCVASRKVRGGIGLHLFVGIVIIIFYLFIYKYFISLGSGGQIWPWLAVWQPIAIFSIVAWIFYRRAQK